MADCKKGVDYIGVGCGALIEDKEGRVLLMKRGSAANNQAGCWTQPGGTVEFGETIKDAIKREIKEEMDVDIELTDFLAVTDHIISEEHQHWVASSYRARILAGEPKNLEPHKCEEIKWFPLDEIPDNLNEPTKDSVAALKKLRGCS